MKIYDISQEVFACEVYPDDPAPKKSRLKSMENGDLYNLTEFSMCAHNGTHIDAPFHFIKDGKTVDKLDLSALVGMAYVMEHHGPLAEADAKRIIEKAKDKNPESQKRILIKGDVEVSEEAAKFFASSGVLLLGNEPQTLGPQNAPMAVHLALLGSNVVLLEGIRLSEVNEGVYFLNAAPLNLSGADGSPCRALLIDLENKIVSPLKPKHKQNVGGGIVKNRKYIPKETDERITVKCRKCIHHEKCVKKLYATNCCGSYKKKAGIRKRNKGE